MSVLNTERLMRYYFWINKKGVPVSRAYPYSDDAELAAAQETPPGGAFGLRTGTKTVLQNQYGLDDSDFEDK